MKKTVLKSFRYIECDDFASYLTEMSAKGWHFKEWKIGLVFEKGTPADISYAVEVFPKGSEMDVCAGPDAEEYAEYCSAAGWKLLDSRRKFCIFRQESPDAPPITTPAERLSNIMRAQWKSWLGDFFSASLLCCLYWLQFLFLYFSDWIFNNVFILLLAFLTLNVLAELLQAFVLSMISYKHRNVLKAGGSPQYSIRHSAWFFKRAYRFLCLLFYPLLLVVAWQSDFHAAAISGTFVFVICVLDHCLVSRLHPSRSENWSIQISLGLTIPFLAAIITLVCVSDGGIRQSTLSGVTVPLSPEAFGTCELKDHGYSQSIFGTLHYYSVDIYGMGTDSSPSDADGFWCYIYQSDHPGILNHIWRLETKNASAQLQDCNSQWNAVCALSDNIWQYYLKYPDRVIVFQTLVDLNEKQIENLRQMLLSNSFF